MLSFVNFLPFVHSREHIFSQITMTLRQNVCLDEISNKFENGSCRVKTKSRSNLRLEGHDGPGLLTWVIFPTNESLFLWFQLVTRGVEPVLIPRGIIWIKLTKVYKKMLHTKNLISIPSSFRKEEFWSWSSLFLCSNLWPGVSFDPKGII